MWCGPLHLPCHLLPFKRTPWRSDRESLICEIIKVWLTHCVAAVFQIKSYILIWSRQMQPTFEEIVGLLLFLHHLCSHTAPNFDMHHFANIREYALLQHFGCAGGSDLDTNGLQVSCSRYRITLAHQLIIPLPLENDQNLGVCITGGRPCLGSV